MHGLHIQRTCFLILAFIFATFLPLLLHPLSKSSNCYCPLSALLFYSLQILRYTLPVPHLPSCFTNWTALIFYFIVSTFASCLYLCLHNSYLSVPGIPFSEDSKLRLCIPVSAFISFDPICFRTAFITSVPATSQQQPLHLHLFARSGFCDGYLVQYRNFIWLPIYSAL
jgi:hypothetical protein